MRVVKPSIGIPREVAGPPVACCIPDPNNVESEGVLFARAKALHPDRANEIVLSEQTSRFRVPPKAA
jgi:hypothetical protein